jgi:hypothetical protein
MESPAAFSTDTMKKPAGKWMLSALVVTVLLAGVFVLANRKTKIDFSDNPALLIQVSDSGTATLDTYHGQISAPLANVIWKTNSAFLAGAQKLVREAQRDKVAFTKSNDGELQIWFETESGPESLNQKLNALLASDEATNPK